MQVLYAQSYRKQVQIYCGSGTVTHTVNQWCHMHFGVGTDSRCMLLWQQAVGKHGHHLESMMSLWMWIYLKNNQAQFWHNPTHNEGALRLFYEMTSWPPSSKYEVRLKVFWSDFILWRWRPDQNLCLAVWFSTIFFVTHGELLDSINRCIFTWRKIMPHFIPIRSEMMVP